MLWGLTYHTIQMVLAFLFVFLAGAQMERGRVATSLLLLAVGILTFLAEVSTFLVFIGPLLN